MSSKQCSQHTPSYSLSCCVTPTSRKSAELEREMNFIKSKYVKLLSEQFKITVPGEYGWLQVGGVGEWLVHMWVELLASLCLVCTQVAE